MTRILATLGALTFLLATAVAAQAADRDRVRAFMSVTGYDAVIESLQQGAMAGPGLVGDAPEAFGRQYTELAQKVFDPKEMQEQAIDMMAAVMPEDLLAFGAEFYASDLGQRLVAVENASHMADDTLKAGEGQWAYDKLVSEQSPKVDLYREMSDAIGSSDTGQKAIVEIQVRFILAAMAADVIASDMTEAELRQTIAEQVKAFGPQLERSGLISNAYTYREISVEDIQAYVTALQTPEMQQLYEVMNAVQYQIMVERYEILGARLGELQPQQDL